MLRIFPIDDCPSGLCMHDVARVHLPNVAVAVAVAVAVFLVVVGRGATRLESRSMPRICPINDRPSGLCMYDVARVHLPNVAVAVAVFLVVVVYRRAALSGCNYAAGFMESRPVVGCDVTYRAAKGAIPAERGREREADGGKE